MEHRRSHAADGLASLVPSLFTFLQVFWRIDGQICMSNMRRVVHGQANSDDKIYNNDVVKGQVPVMDHRDKEEIDEKNRQHDKACDWQTACDKEDHKEDSND